MKGSAGAFDVAVVGAGPAGCVAALAHARAGARVALLEANPRALDRLAGEWLHPRGVRILRELGIDLVADCSYESGRGFAVFPEDGSAPIVLPYADRDRGYSGEHAALVETLRKAATEHPSVVYLPGARVREIARGGVVFGRAGRGDEMRIGAGRVVGADGRASRMRAALGLADDRKTLSRMAGLKLKGVELPVQGFGHVFLGGPGPVLAYRIGDGTVRFCLDVPLSAADDASSLYDAYAPALPEPLREAFAQALRQGPIAWAINRAQSRLSYGKVGLALIGDAVGFQHPLTAVGLTHAFADASLLAQSKHFGRFVRARQRSTRVSEFLAGILYEVFSENTPSAAAIRHGMYHIWRTNPKERSRTMRYLAGEDGQAASFARSFARVTGPALVGLIAQAARSGDRRGAARVLRELGGRAAWLVRGVLPGIGTGVGVAAPLDALEAARSSRNAVSAVGAAGERIAQSRALPGASACTALERGVQALASTQREDGSFEGEVAWCPMLAAQYVLFCEALGVQIPAARRKGLLRHFERTRLADGLWGLHELSEPYLFVTTLVYVASRLLGVPADAPNLEPARAFIRREGVLKIPSWGKLWLALLGLYDWRGAPPILPELWALPTRLPPHPSSFYCHTRHIYLAMSALYGRRVRAPESKRLGEIRSELYPHGMEGIDWNAARAQLRDAELNSPPGMPLRLVYRLFAAYDKRHHAGLRRRILRELDDRIRWELETTDYTSLSPVSGLLNILALHAAHPDDPDVQRALERLEAWFWHDEQDGTRIAGARSASWDTSFALQALTASGPDITKSESAEKALDRGVAFLRTQQIRESFPGYREAFRLDPRGGFCFASVWHGWPVSDCTAEALDALAAAAPGALGLEAERDAARFILRCQNPDGGFGSYEARRTRIGLEWLNPAEMFGESMTEHSYVECTASSLAALAGFQRRYPGELQSEIESAIARAERRLRALQQASGAWRGVWGVHFLYGTLFGVRGLVAAGAPPGDPALRRACAWVRAQQRSDGGWGEHHRGCLSGRYEPHRHSQAIQTAWALMTLLEAHDPDWTAIARGAELLIGRQDASGSWPREEPAGLFFRTALLDYELYRAYFPLWALALYEARRKERFSRRPPDLPDIAHPEARPGGMDAEPISTDGD